MEKKTNMNPNLITCQGCGKLFSNRAERCPQCNLNSPLLFLCRFCGKNIFSDTQCCPNCSSPDPIIDNSTLKYVYLIDGKEFEPRSTHQLAKLLGDGLLTEETKVYNLKYDGIFKPISENTELYKAIFEQSSKEETLVTCLNCQHMYSEKAMFCPECKTKPVKCIQCMEIIPSDSRNCPECGDPAPFEQTTEKLETTVTKKTANGLSKEKTSYPASTQMKPQSSHNSEQSIVNMKVSSILFSFTGCSRRLHFWLVVPIIWILSLFFKIFIGFELDSPEPDYSLIIGMFIAFTPVLWINLAVQIKRWHDRNKSGYWVFIHMLPLIGTPWALIELGFFPRKSEGNKYTTSE